MERVDEGGREGRVSRGVRAGVGGGDVGTHSWPPRLTGVLENGRTCMYGVREKGLVGLYGLEIHGMELYGMGI